MAKYQMWLDFSTNPQALAETEQGGPQRRFDFCTRREAVGASNAVLMAAGMPMRNPPHRMNIGDVYHFASPDGSGFDGRIIRVA